MTTKLKITKENDISIENTKIEFTYFKVKLKNKAISIKTKM
jgi:hypothetical protein